VRRKKLFDQFPPVATREWTDRINADLRGADFSEKLVWKTNEGFDVMPFYRREDMENLPFTDTLPGEFPYLRGNKTGGNGWLVRQNIEVSDYYAANRKALDILMKGIDSLGFIIVDPESVSRENFDILLKDIRIESIEINFHSAGKAKEILDILSGIVSGRGLDPEKIQGAIEADPLGRLMQNGSLCVSVGEGFDYLASLTAKASELISLWTIHFDAAYFRNAGFDTVQELAYGLSAGTEYISQLTARGVSAEAAASKIRFSFGTGPDYFMEIAKLRAARLLWSVILKGFIPEGCKDIRMQIHTVTGRQNKTINDPYVNMLRTQTEAMSAILGGTDSLTVEPYDSVFRKPDEFSERIARNQQLILKEEAYFDKVADPAAGSYYIEKLTDLIVEKSWRLFIETEDLGGFISLLTSGYMKKKISEMAAKRKTEKENETSIQI
jgi:methylmalonyl-CoA mutase